MSRVPVLPTILVTVAVAAMLALGIWQLTVRLPAKEAYLAQLAANPAKPPIAFPRFPDDTLLFRRATGFCLQPTAIRVVGAGAAGFRAIAECRTGAEGPGITVQLGTTHDPDAKPHWSGGPVAGYIGHAPDARPLIATAIDHRPERPMLVLSPPAAGLAPNGTPDLSAVPNNHLAYAVQWFLFALVATIIYAVALYRRRHPVARVPTRG